MCPLLVLFVAFWSIRCATSQDVKEQTVLNPSLTRNCTKSHLTADGIFNGNVPISAYDLYFTNEFPKMTHLNASTWELWYFDAVSAFSDAAITVSFFWDGSQSALGKGSLRTKLTAIWPDGSAFHTENFAEKSTVESCPEEAIKAYWGGEGESTLFELTHDLREARVDLELAAVQGTMSLSSLAPAFKADDASDSSAEVSPLFASTIYWLQSIPRASVDVNFTIDGRELSFSGIGGHDRFWTP